MHSEFRVVWSSLKRWLRCECLDSIVRKTESLLRISVVSGWDADMKARNLEYIRTLVRSQLSLTHTQTPEGNAQIADALAFARSHSILSHHWPKSQFVTRFYGSFDHHKSCHNRGGLHPPSPNRSLTNAACISSPEGPRFDSRVGSSPGAPMMMITLPWFPFFCCG